jgi:hypothetical protein
MNISATQFDGKDIRRVYDEASETWWFSVVGVVQVLTESRSARRYWSDLSANWHKKRVPSNCTRKSYS